MINEGLKNGNPEELIILKFNSNPGRVSGRPKPEKTQARHVCAGIA
jgi:hypothetical protein